MCVGFGQKARQIFCLYLTPWTASAFHDDSSAWKITSVIVPSVSSPFLQTFNTSNVSALCPGAECLFAFYGGETLYHKYLILFQFYNVFLFFWCANFVTALGQVTLSGAFASYYWAFKKPEDIPAYPIFASLGRALRLETEFVFVCSIHLFFVRVRHMLMSVGGLPYLFDRGKVFHAHS